MAGEVPDTEARYEPTKKKICYMQKHCPNLHLFLNAPAFKEFRNLCFDYTNCVQTCPVVLSPE